MTNSTLRTDFSESVSGVARWGSEDWLYLAVATSARFSCNLCCKRHLAIPRPANWLRLAQRAGVSGPVEPRNWVRLARWVCQVRAGSAPEIGFVSHRGGSCTQTAIAPRIGFVWQTDHPLVTHVPGGTAKGLSQATGRVGETFDRGRIGRAPPHPKTRSNKLASQLAWPCHPKQGAWLLPPTRRAAASRRARTY
jgi:hypothetical protein